MSVLVEFAMFPTDKGESVSAYVSRIIKMVDESGVTYKLTPMGTIFETETIEEALEIIKKAYETLEPDCNRVYSVVKFDIRKGKSGRMVQKIKSVESRLNREVSK
ncbi:MAG: MTH1187 family thiamine-binding protein [Desulfurobacteriaceae bacterium]